MLIHLPAARAVARVDSTHAVAQQQVRVARFLEQRDVPAVRLLDPLAQPVVTDGVAVTLWRWLDILPRQATAAELGRLARRLHTQTTNAPATIAAVDPLTIAQHALQADHGMGDLSDLSERLALLRSRWPALLAADPLGEVLTHGDLHTENVAWTADGPVLLDLEMSGRGPPSWDLIPQRTRTRRYGGDAEWCRQFEEGYGTAIGTWAGTELLREAYELMLALWAIEHRGRSPALAAEATLRLASMRGATERVWTLL